MPSTNVHPVFPVRIRVALLEDDTILRDRVLVPRLTDYGFMVTGLETAEELQRHLATESPDIVVLDVGLPDGDGFTVARELRVSSPTKGIVMLTARGETHDRVRGLTEGADAYLSKPVDIELLAATLHTLARRVLGSEEGTQRADGTGWNLDAEGWCLVVPSGSNVPLTRSERRVLERMMSTPGKLVSREQLIAAVTSNVHDYDPHRLDTLIHRLRRKVSSTSGKTLPLTAVHGEGYIFRV